MDRIDYAHGFCTMHRTAYNRDLDPTCPQCAMQRIMPPEQLDFDATHQKPRNAAGALVNARTLREEA